MAGIRLTVSCKTSSRLLIANVKLREPRPHINSPSSSPLQYESLIINMQRERDLTCFVEAAKVKLSVVCRNINCQHVILATGLDLRFWLSTEKFLDVVS